MFRPTPFEINNDRFYYEPRALWSVGRVVSAPLLNPQTLGHPAGFLQLPKEHFRNGSRWPIRITHAIVSPIGYLFRNIDVSSPTNPAQYDAAMAGIGRMKMAIAFPKRSWIERLNTDVMSFATEPTGEPSMDSDPILDHSSGLFGVSRWTFDPSYILPFRSTIEILLSTIQAYGQEFPAAPASLAVHERGGRMLGHSRTRAPADLEYGPNPIPPDYFSWPQTHSATPPDNFALINGLAGPQNQAFPPSQKWPSDDYRRQQASRGLPYTEVTGFAVAIDQSAVDDYIDVGIPGGQFAPISQRIITKGRTRDAGTQEAWWRDGAPLSLVTPTMNNAGFVHKFEQPFELGRGEGLEVALQAPAPRTFTATPAQGPPVEITVAPAYNVGVSFLGYAIVEDNNTKVYR